MAFVETKKTTHLCWSCIALPGPTVVFSCKDETKLESEFRETTASWNTISTDSYVNLHRRTQPTACRIYMTLQSSRDSRRFQAALETNC